MKKLLVTLGILGLLMILPIQVALAGGGKQHGDVGNGSVFQEDPFGPGDQPDWQDD